MGLKIPGCLRVRTGLPTGGNYWTAIARLASRGDVAPYERTNLRDGQVAAITGHKTLQVLKRYTNLTTDHLADKLG